MLEKLSLSSKLWGTRILVIAGIVLLCVLAGSAIPSWAICVTFSPNGLFLAAFMRGALRWPRALEPVKPIEPVIYHWLGVGLIKRIVQTRTWPRLMGSDPPNTPKDRQAFLDHIEQSTRVAEICHAVTFILAMIIALYSLAVDQIAMAIWILVFNQLLNGYPVMLQRSNRFRIQQLRASSLGERHRG